jgi:hypothetical protein
MLWALLALYLFEASGSSELTVAFERAKTFIRTDVQDKERRAELLSLVDEIEKETKDEVQFRGTIVKELASISERHDATAADIQPVLARYRAEAEAYQGRMVRYRFELRSKMTREEWARVFPAEMPASGVK